MNKISKKINSVFDKSPDGVFFMPIGGAEQVGMNMYLYGYKGKWIMVEAGISFHLPEIAGDDIAIPDPNIFQWLGSSLSAIIVTHAHEDHIGGIPFFTKMINCPVFVGSFAREFLKHKCKDMKCELPKLRAIESNRPFKAGSFSITATQVAHSIPETFALTIQAGSHKILHSSDWKFDESQENGSEQETLRHLKKSINGDLLAMVGDSTNANKRREKRSATEETVFSNIKEKILSLKNAVVVTLFASNVERLVAIARAGVEAGRQPIFLGRSLWRIYEVALAANIWDTTIKPLSDREAKKYPIQKLLYIVTGCQGEDRAALSRISFDAHPHLELIKGDSVIFSSSVIPGNGKMIFSMQNRLAKKGVDIIYNTENFHTSGHADAQDIEKIIQYLQPKIVAPMHGEWQMRQAHKEIALNNGAKSSPIPAHGEVVDFTSKNPEKCSKLCEPLIHAVEGAFLIPSSSGHFKRRQILMTNGAIHFSCVMVSGKMSWDSIQLSFEGVDDSDSDILTAEIIEKIRHDLYKKDFSKDARKSKKRKSSFVNSLDPIKSAISSSIKSYIKKNYEKNPCVTVHIHY